MTMNLKHQQQPTNNTCVSTCIAMILDKPVEEVVGDFHDLYMDQKIEVDEFLHRCNIKCRPMLSDNSQFTTNRIFILSVPSLNTDAMMHQILAYYDDDDLFCIQDPNKGREGKRYYIDHYIEPTNEYEIHLRSYCFGYEVWYQ